MNFQVPQFIEVEDKIFGPLTFKQFAYLAGGAGACFIIYVIVRQLSVILALLLMVPVGGLAGALAFYNVNNRPLIVTLEAAFKYWFTHKLYLWKKVPPKAAAAAPALPPAAAAVPRLSESKLQDLSWSLDVKEHLEQ